MQYCNKLCLERDWPRHKKECTDGKYPPDANKDKAGSMVVDDPAFWAPYAATDVLNLDKNEGSYYDDRLQVLLLPRTCTPID